MGVVIRYVIREKFFRVTEDSVIKDEHWAPVYQVKGKIFSLHHTLVLMDLTGNELATVKKQIISITPKFHITRGGEEVATVRKKLISPFVDRFSVDIPGPDDLHVTGGIFEHNFTIERKGQLVATVSKHWSPWCVFDPRFRVLHVRAIDDCRTRRSKQPSGSRSGDG